MAIVRRLGRKLCDDRILALRSLAIHHHASPTLGMQIGVGSGFLINFVICGLILDILAPAGDIESIVLFFLGETVLLLGPFVAVAGYALVPILDRADIAGVNRGLQMRFVFLEFATHPVTLVAGASIAIAGTIVFWPYFMSIVMVLLLICSWLAMAAATAALLIMAARKLSVAPAGLAIGALLLLLLVSLGPLALAGGSLLRYAPLCGWTANGIIALQYGDPLTALLWLLLQGLSAAAMIVGLRWEGGPHEELA